MDNWSLEKIASVLRAKDSNIVLRIEALFHARFEGSLEALRILEEALWHPSVLLKHEIAYVMGQMGHLEALPTLIALADDLSQDEMVRHEAGEAIHALGATSDEALACITRHLQDPSEPVRQTMELAHFGIMNRRRKKAASARAERNDPAFYLLTRTNVRDKDNVVFSQSVDPVEGELRKLSSDNIAQLGAELADETKPLHVRYSALFTLRNNNTVESALAIARALDEKSSALLRHEIAFVLGQMQFSETADALIARLRDRCDAPMSRHEAAISLGSVGAVSWTAHGRTTTPRVIAALQEFLDDECEPVRESCKVALYNIQSELGLPVAV